jgi:hypothetical protein
LCGIEPVEPGYKLFQIVPNPGSVKQSTATIQSVKGIIKSSFENSGNIFKLSVTVLNATEAIIGISAEKVSTIKLNNKIIWEKGSVINDKIILKYYGIDNGHILFRIFDGNYSFEARRND